MVNVAVTVFASAHTDSMDQPVSARTAPSQVVNNAVGMVHAIVVSASAMMAGKERHVSALPLAPQQMGKFAVATAPASVDSVSAKMVGDFLTIALAANVAERRDALVTESVSAMAHACVILASLEMTVRLLSHVILPLVKTAWLSTMEYVVGAQTASVVRTNTCA